ncbi:MAG: TlpA disulfide reductase family protein [Bacteroidota bacterium]
MKNIILLIVLGCFVFSLQAQEQTTGYRTIKVNGKTYTFKQQAKPQYPYEVDLKTVSGETINSSKLFAQNGKPTVLLFWMTTCVPCQYELAAIHKKYDSWTKEADFNFYAISMEMPKYAHQFAPHVKKKAWQFEAYFDFERQFRYIMPDGLNGLPQTFLLDKDGEIVYHKRKYRMGDEDILFDEIRILIAKSQ